MRLAFVAVLPLVSGHAFLASPRPRQWRSDNASWVTVNVLDDDKPFLWYGDTEPVNNDVGNLNAGIGGAAANSQTVGGSEGDHGLCGDIGSRKAFMAGGLFGPTVPQVMYVAGGVARVSVQVTSYHAGWLEFRLAVPADGGADYTIPVTQALLNEHVLQVAASTPRYPGILNYTGMRGYGGYTGHGGEYRCPVSGNHADPTSTSKQGEWPHGSCCNSGGACSEPEHNLDRYILEFGVDSENPSREEYQTEYTLDLMIPEGVECVRCVLQMTYMTANSADGFPETFWNCADVAVTAAATGAAAAAAGVHEDLEGGSGDGDDDDDALVGDADGDDSADKDTHQDLVQRLREHNGAHIAGTVVAVGIVLLVAAGVYGRMYPPKPGSRGHANYTVTDYNDNFYSYETTPLLGTQL